MNNHFAVASEKAVMKFQLLDVCVFVCPLQLKVKIVILLVCKRYFCSFTFTFLMGYGVLLSTVYVPRLPKQALTSQLVCMDTQLTISSPCILLLWKTNQLNISKHLTLDNGCLPADIRWLYNQLSVGTW